VTSSWAVDFGLMDEPVTVLVDARNVLRSRWPNIPERELVEGCERWAAEHGARSVVVFDGTAPHVVDTSCEVVGTGGESADDWLTREAARLALEGRPYWLVTSDRELRDRAGKDAERVIGGGSLARELT
jgi:hypothetical protein